MAIKKATQSVTVGDLVGKRPASPAPEQPPVEASATPVRRRIHVSSVADSSSNTDIPQASSARISSRTIPVQSSVRIAVSSNRAPSVAGNNQPASHAAPASRNHDQSAPVSHFAPADKFTPAPEARSFNNQGNMHQPQSTPTDVVRGFLDIQIEGHGFLRPKFIPSSRDIYISQSQIRRFMLRPGDEVEGLARPPKDTERYYGLLKVEKVNGIAADESLKRPLFDDLTPIYPNKQLILSTGQTPISTRMIDLIAPIGFGQRGMIVSPPKAGKTTILKEIAAGISKNFPKAHLMAALIGERPEEVTDISMSVKGEVVASNFDEPPENQTRIAEVTLDRAKRLVELGRDVIILLDSITRLARAYNLNVDPSGRTLSGGFDPAALYPAKRFFGAARNCQEGGSLTIIGTALVETGSRMDDLIYEEFKGTGNMELHLVRAFAERRIYPAISIERSGTRGEERILPESAYKKIVTMRRMMDMLGADERTSILVERLAKTETNEAFLETLGKG